jgi:hypothetical protein
MMDNVTCPYCGAPLIESALDPLWFCVADTCYFSGTVQPEPILAIIARLSFRHAKPMPHIPHQYTVRQEAGDEADYIALHNAIGAHSVLEHSHGSADGAASLWACARKASRAATSTPATGTATGTGEATGRPAARRQPQSSTATGSRKRSGCALRG